jgi:two-component system chemotaxis response regulator CheY
MAYRILLVDDNETILHWAKGVLRKAGYETITRSEPIGTGAAIVRESPDLVIMDVNMPRLEGDEVVSSLRRSPKGSMTRVVLCSSLPFHELSEKARACGADGFFCKTSDKVEFLRQVERFLPRETKAARSNAMVIAESDFQKTLAKMALNRFSDLEMVVCRDQASAIEKWHNADNRFVLLIVFDHDVPELDDGRAIVAARTTNVPIVLVVSNPLDGASRERAQQLGIGQLLSGAVTPAALAEAIQSVRG